MDHPPAQHSAAALNPPFRVGHGYDIHGLESGRRLVLGGVEIPHALGLAGHSDADCLTHALADAVLGAMGLPDIGHFFPNSDPSLAGIDSQIILRRAVEEAALRGYSVANADLTLVAEAPKVGPYREAMREVLARSLRIDPSQVGLKATTNEGLGAIGSGLGICAYASVLLMRQVSPPIPQL